MDIPRGIPLGNGHHVSVPSTLKHCLSLLLQNLQKFASAELANMPMPNSLLLLHLRNLIIFILAQFASAETAYMPSPVECSSNGCTVSSYQGMWLDRIPCKAAVAVYPTTEEELTQAVAYAAKTKSKVKVVSRGSHSIPKLVCPGGDEGAIISTRDLNSRIIINSTAMTVTADAGVQLRDLLDGAAEAGLTLPHTPHWEGVSVAGCISTGAHGSGIWGRGSAPHDYVVGMRMIVPATEDEGWAKVVELKDGDEELDAARISLGVLGAISQVTFALEPLFKRSVKVQIHGDERLEEEIEEFARQHEFGWLFWYPDLRKCLYKLDDRVSINTEGEGSYKHPLLEPIEVEKIEALTAIQEALQEMKSSEELCNKCELTERYMAGDGYLNDGISFTRFPVVGYNHRMETGGSCDRSMYAKSMHDQPIVTPAGIQFHDDKALCELISPQTIINKQNSTTCSWNSLIKSLLIFDTSISIPIAHIHDAILDIKKLRDANPQAMCSFTNFYGIWIRFLKASKAYLGERTDSVMLEVLYYRPRQPNQPRFKEDIAEEFEQMLLNKFGGKPHWGKNRNHAFEGMLDWVTNLPKFLEARERLDPDQLFSNEWSDAILNMSGRVQIVQDHCALEGLCVCSNDSHCHPSKRYFCRPGSVFKEARVCRYEIIPAQVEFF